MQFGIKHRVLLLALVPTITISVLLVTYFVNTRLQDLEEAFRAHGERIALKLEKELNDTYSDLSQIENLSGWLKLELETKSIKLREYQILAKAILIFLFGLSISALLAYRMGRNLTHPILEIGEVVNKIREGALNTRTQVSSYPELKMLGSGINAMAETLENAHNELQHKINQATLSLRRTLETIEVQNIELEMSRRAAEHANKIKSEFLADMSHEIRTPLNGVVGFVNLLQKTELNQKQQEYIRTIQKSANNLLAILNDILDFSKMEAGKLRIEQSMMDIRECIDEILNLLLPHAQEKNIALIPLIYSDVPTQVLSDPLRLKQIVTNLVSNAIKFTERGSVIVRVMLENESFSHTTIRVHVTDTGIGLSPEEQKVLFHAFNQTKTGATHKLGGTGLGLVISKKLVEQMGGTIGVESEPQKGSTFWFTFQVESTPQVEFTPQVEPTLETQP
ncbi:MAG TPA: ATP-binding protein, partial [Gammaproteobacteria bacterium]|nr:ATP-binding protein [Gammaproteobacteria bacterium]